MTLIFVNFAKKNLKNIFRQFQKKNLIFVNFNTSKGRAADQVPVAGVGVVRVPGDGAQDRRRAGRPDRVVRQVQDLPHKKWHPKIKQFLG